MNLISTFDIKTVFYAVTFSFLIGIHTAYAQTGSSEPEFEMPNVENLQKQIDELKATVNASERRSAVEPQPGDTIITWNPAPKLETRDGRFSFETNS
ncbi:MAG: hypothetical protein HOH19_04100 [Kordiimonadaceae bacterium]|nr:hypothetical protein [Kordiimonadaceae bacterium]MBT6031735.1 hypothetical protein [Kordiimonadaceae bacterium]